MAKKKIEHTDGLGPHERKKLNQACRQVWYRTHSRNLVKKRCRGEDGFQYCEQCKERTPKFTVDHILPAGPIDSPGYLVRLFCPSSQLQGLCDSCHKEKTRAENKRKTSVKGPTPAVGTYPCHDVYETP